ncbi:hypothetical protein Goari_000052 [Gossypium aridum]|uniref:RNase H type-1 domain-containing protein n=1 Tax=Gossypium aridum TaxID=34290 RepID=A0A7J8YN55_GOSAI|nr:hypothetical protein [Gossypium aridum]
MSWRVGRGESISIWKDNWTQGVDKIGTQNRTNRGELQLVLNLIDFSDRFSRVGSEGKLNGVKDDKSVIGAIIRDIQKKKADFQELIFQHIHRSENSYAHRLAKIVLEKEEDTYLRGEELEGHAFALVGT